MTGPGWKALGASVRGASHRRSGAPNQDAIAWVERADGIVAAVSDGHGSSLSFRSDVGASFGVESAQRAAETPTDAGFPSSVVREWRSLVERDLARHPLTDTELDRVRGERGGADADAIRDDPYLAYGATLLFARATADAVEIWQIGDGDVVVARTPADNAGGATRPVPSDDRLIGNVTTSLCGADAAADFRHARVPVRAGDAVTVMLSTDGYANSFVDDDAFLKVGEDIHGFLAQQGPPWVSRNLRGWLEDASERGSGDDISAVVLFTLATASSPAADPAASKKRRWSGLQLLLVAGLALALGAGVGRAAGGGPAPDQTAASTSPSPTTGSVTPPPTQAPITPSATTTPSSSSSIPVPSSCADLGLLRTACQDAVGAAALTDVQKGAGAVWIVSDAGTLYRLRASGADTVLIEDFIVSIATGPDVVATGRRSSWAVNPDTLAVTPLASA